MRTAPLPRVHLDPEARRYLFASPGPLRLEFADPGGGCPWPLAGLRVEFAGAQAGALAGAGALVGAGLRAGFRWTGGRLPVVVTTGARDEHRVLLVAAPRVPGVVAALLLEVRDGTGRLPVARFSWPEPARHLLGTGPSCLATGVRELLYRAEPDRARRPRVQVGPAAG